MRRVRLAAVVAMLGVVLSAPSPAAEELEMTSDKLELKVEIPRLDVSEYHRPYVAMWIQNQKDDVVANLAVWYQVKGPDEDFGTKWLPDLRQWWRRSGRGLEFPVDGVSGPTRPAGEHTLSFDSKKLEKLAPGKYTVVVEAAREVGGREVLEIPFNWPGDESTTYEVQGKKELGKITLTVKP